MIFLPLNAARQRVLGRNQAKARSVGSIYVKVHDGESDERGGGGDQGAAAPAPPPAARAGRRFLAAQPRRDRGDARSERAHARDPAGRRRRRLARGRRHRHHEHHAGLGHASARARSGCGSPSARASATSCGNSCSRRPGWPPSAARSACCSGSAAAYIISHAAGWPLLIEPDSIVLAVAFSGLVGVFFGWYPALRASRLDPIEALRHT